MNGRNIEGNVAIVTGAGRGIGRSIAIALAQKGVKVALAARSENELREVAEYIVNRGGEAKCFAMDIGNEKRAVSLVENTVGCFGKLDILINNAAIGMFGPLARTTTQQWDTIMQVNARGPFIICRESVKYLAKQKLSYIINISSVVGVKAYENQSAYSASKHALMGMTKSLAREVMSMGIRVHAICPGGVDTGLVRNSRPDLNPSVLIMPDEIADVVMFLVTRQGNGVIDEIHIRRETSMPWA